MEIRAISEEFMEQYKKLRFAAICFGLIAYAVLFYFFFSYLYADLQIKDMLYWFAFWLVLMVPFTILLLETMIHWQLKKTIGKEKRVSLNSEGIDIFDVEHDQTISKHFCWSQISQIEIFDMSPVLGRLTKWKLYKMRVITDGEQYDHLREQYNYRALEMNHPDKLKACCIEMEYLPLVLEEIKRYSGAEFSFISRKDYLR